MWRAWRHVATAGAQSVAQHTKVFKYTCDYMHLTRRGNEAPSTQTQHGVVNKTLVRTVCRGDIPCYQQRRTIWYNISQSELLRHMRETKSQGIWGLQRLHVRRAQMKATAWSLSYGSSARQPHGSLRINLVQSLFRVH